jgi:hypothetical protein
MWVGRIFYHPSRLRPVCAQVLDFAHEHTYPSDHYPLLATLQPLTTPHLVLAEAAADFKRMALNASASASSSTSATAAPASAAPASSAAAAPVSLFKPPGSAPIKPASAASKPAGAGAAGSFPFPIPQLMINQVKAACPKRSEAQIRDALFDTSFDVDAAIRALS